jgi:protein SCO1/2
MRAMPVTSSPVRTLLLAAVVCAAAAPAGAQGGPGNMRSQIGVPSSAKVDLLQDIRFDQRLDEQVPVDLLFRDEHGATVRLGDYFGKRPIVLALVYYECPMLCSQVLSGLVSALGVLRFDAGREYDVVAVSFNPREGPGLASGKKRSYMERYTRPGTDAGVHFLTGPPESIARLTASVGFQYAWDEETRQYAHAAGVVVLTPAGRVSKYFYGIEYSPRDLRLGLVQASAQTIGTPVDSLLLYCYHYDPTTGTYGLMTMTLVRIGGVLTILALVTFWVVMWRRERHLAHMAGAGTRV